MSEPFFEIRFTGGLADQNTVDLYDVSQAIEGFQRTLAITTHLVLNGEVITQAPALKNAQILSVPFQEGSWRAAAIIVPAAAVLLSASDSSLPGFLIKSAFSYVVQEATGVEIDYESGTLQEQLEDHRTLNDKKLDRSRLDSVVEKCENSIKKMHRPIVKSKTAERAELNCEVDRDPKRNLAVLNGSTFEYVSKTVKSELYDIVKVKVSSYNINTFMGRVFSDEFGNRTVPFTLMDSAKRGDQIARIIGSMSANAVERNSEFGYIFFECRKYESVTGRLKGLMVSNVFTEAQMKSIVQ